MNTERYLPKAGPLQVHRRPPVVSKVVRREYGPSLGDGYETTISRTGDRVSITQNRSSKVDWAMGSDEARLLAESILAVLDWQDAEETSPDA